MASLSHLTPPHPHTHTQSYPPQSPHSIESSVKAVESVPRLPPISVPRPGSDATQREAADSTQAETNRQVGAFSASTESQWIKTLLVWSTDLLSSPTGVDGVYVHVGRDYDGLINLHTTLAES